MSGRIRVGVGGWTFAPWRGLFYPKGLPHAKELAYASRALTSIEINGTYYSSFKPATWAKWRDETPDDFVFAVKASRFATNRKRLGEAGPSIAKFLGQGLTELGPKLGPINWQLAPTKRFDADEMAAFLALLPAAQDGVKLRHAVEVRHPSFEDRAFVALARKHKVAVVYATGDRYPQIEAATGPITYARIMSSRPNLVHGLPPARLREVHAKAVGWSRKGDVFLFFIAAAKERNPAAAQAVLKRLGAT